MGIESFRLPETNSEFTPENGWLEYDCFLLGWPIFRCELLVLGRVVESCIVKSLADSSTPYRNSSRTIIKAISKHDETHTPKVLSRK